MGLTLLDILRCGVAPTQARAIQPHMAVACQRFGITSPERVAAFFGQLIVESAGFTRCEENLRYTTPDRIATVWPSRFASAQEAAPFVLQPKALANRVYAGRNGNGDEASGDGWRYRGRAWKQLTGRSNYARAGAALQQPYVDSPDLLLEPEGACLVSAWFWADAGCNKLADAWDLDTITRRVNGPARLKSARRRALSEIALRALVGEA